MSSAEPELESQAAFAKRMNVSRAAVTGWKKSGAVIMVGERVDVAASLQMLAMSTSQLGSARRGAPRGAKLSSHPVKAAPKQKQPSTIYDYLSPSDFPAVWFFLNAEGAAQCAAILLLRQFPLEVVQPLIADLLRELYQHAAETLHYSDIKPPAAFTEWNEYAKSIEEPYFCESWPEMAEDAAQLGPWPTGSGAGA